MRFFISLTAALMSLLAITAHAESVAGLYQVREELTSQESEVRDAGLQQAFATLVQRLTGEADAVQSSQLAQYQADPQALISRYGYEGNTLIVSFDPQSVQSALRAAKLPVWGNNRPAVLTWWLVEDLQGVHLISDGQAGADMLHNAAQYYGVPARLPLGDLDEQLLVGADALNDNTQIRESAERYTADAVVIVEQRLEAETLQAQWQLWIGDERQMGQVTADSEATLARDVFAQVNQRLAERFSIKPGEGESFEIRVAGVDLERFVLVERLLEPFSAQLREVTKEYAQWQVRSTPEQLRSQLALAHLNEQAAPLLTTEQEFSDADLNLPEPTRSSVKAAADTQLLYFSW